MSTDGVPGLVPELLVTDLASSVDFWCGLCGFGVRYERPDEGFAYVERDGAEVMLEQVGVGRNWLTGPLEAPLGRGINLQISVGSLAPILSALRTAGRPLFMEPETRSYLVGQEPVEVEQFLVCDPDGYLLRFSCRR